MSYKIELKIETLAQNAVMNKAERPSFTVEGITFFHWEFNIRDGWLQDAWIAQAELEAINFHEAFKTFNSRLGRIIPRISLISQSYIEYLNQPFLILKQNSDTAFFRYVVSRDGAGLMFMEQEKKALDILLVDNTIPQEFFYYWNDAVNSYGYPPKLLLMFSAIEALVKNKGQKKDWGKTELILGKELTQDLFGTKANPHTGLRHRLVHGEYFNSDDSGKNYLELVHKKVINYFNTVILKENLIEENVVQPQRHFFGNREESKNFIKLKGAQGNLELKEVLADFDKNDIYNLEKYEFVFDDTLNSTY